jgi:hypothetical protein
MPVDRAVATHPKAQGAAANGAGLQRCGHAAALRAAIRANVAADPDRQCHY